MLESNFCGLKLKVFLQAQHKFKSLISFLLVFYFFHPNLVPHAPCPKTYSLLEGQLLQLWGAMGISIWELGC